MRSVRLVLAIAAALIVLGSGTAQAATFTVTSTADDGPGTLRQAIVDANASGDADTIEVTATGTIALASPLPTLDGELDIDGPGSAQLTVDATGTAAPVFEICSCAIVGISGLTATGGLSSGDGGGILNGGDLTLTDAVVSGNTALARGGGIQNDGGARAEIVRSTISGNMANFSTVGAGGGVNVELDAQMTMVESTVTDNTSATNAGGVRVQGTATILRSTIEGNQAMGGFAGGIGVTSEEEEGGAGTLRLENSTVTDNSATVNGGGVGGFGNVTLVSDTIASNSAPSGANIVAEIGGALSVQNTIVADPGGGAPNCTVNGGTLVSNGNNIDSDDPGSCAFSQPTDQQGVDPLLAGLGDNGGPTQTRALGAGSPAIDKGTAAGLTAGDAGRVTDQRGIVRPVRAQADVGAFEVAAPTAVTGDASDVTGASAKLEGTATNPSLSTGQYQFLYGTEDDPTRFQTGTQTISAQTDAQSVSLAVGGLQPNTTYHYRLRVTNPEGESIGEDRTFTTPDRDTTVPTITIDSPQDGATYTQGQTVRANFSCSDPLGPQDVVSCEGSQGVGDGDPVDTARMAPAARSKANVVATGTTGSKSFTVTAVDQAGNTATKTVHYTVEAAPSADLKLTHKGAPGRVRVGRKVTYRLTVTNNGLDRATRVRLVDRLSGRLKLLSVATAGGISCKRSGRTISCKLPNLEAGKSTGIVVRARAKHAGPALSTARVSGARRDPRPANNKASVSTSIHGRGGRLPNFTG